MMPDANELAALLDGRLSASERERVLEQIATSPELSSIYADAILAIRELEEGSAATPLRPAPSVTPPRLEVEPSSKRTYLSKSNRRWTLVGIAAVAVLAVSTELLVTRSGEPVERLGSPAMTVALLDRTRHGDSIPTDGLRATRGALTDAASPRGRATRLGALQALAELQLAARDSLVSITVEQAAQVFDSVPAGSPVSAALRGIARSPDNPESRQLLSHATDAAERFVDIRAMRVGAWLVVLRTAAIRQDSQFVRSDASQSAIWELQELASASTESGSQELAAAVDRLDIERTKSAINWQTLDECAVQLLQLLRR